MSKRNCFGSQFEKLPKKDAADNLGRNRKNNRNKSRQCVYINGKIHNRIYRIIHIIAAGQDISIDEYIDMILSQHLKEHCKQAAKRNYHLRFLKKADVVARRGKLVYVREEYHERIQRIANSIGKGEVSLFSYIDNVLAEHFATHREVITALYNEHNRSIF